MTQLRPSDRIAPMAAARLNTILTIDQRMRDIHTTIKNLHGSEFHKILTPFVQLIRAAMKKHSIDSELEALIHILKNHATHINEFHTLNFTAAVVDLIEHPESWKPKTPDSTPPPP